MMGVLIFLGFLLVVAGIIGCVLPIVPGPPLSYCSLLLVSIARDWKAFTPRFLIIMGVLALVATALDYVIPLIFARRFGASKYGIIFSIIGMIIGIIFFPPFGLVIGAFLGAVIGEFIHNMNTRESLRAGIGVFLGTITSVFVKLGTSGVITFYFVRAVFR
jgi:hypothetical protein